MGCLPQDKSSSSSISTTPTVISARSACTLTGGEVVQSGWSGQDTGSNYCNSCKCGNAALACTEMACAPVGDSVHPTTLTTTTGKMCELQGGGIVPSGWSGKGKGADHCNTCRCSDGMMACTKMMCPPQSTAEPATVTTTKEASSSAMCTLSDGVTKVAAGWSGKDRQPLSLPSVCNRQVQDTKPFSHAQNLSAGKQSSARLLGVGGTFLQGG